MIKNADGVEYETPYAVVCRKGKFCLTEEEYDLQMRLYDDGWFCPKCQEYAEWDDDCPTTNPGDDVSVSDYYGYEDGAFVLIKINE